MIKQFITWDLGATKCRAGVIEFNEDTQSLLCTKHHTVHLNNSSSLYDLIQQIEIGLNFEFASAEVICIGAAGYFDGQALLHANSYPYPMPFAQIAKKERWPNYAVIHDYSSIICATFTDYMHDLNNVKRLNWCEMNPHGRRVALGIGTGLGLKDGVLFPNGDFWLGSNEAGHIGISTPPQGSEFHLNRHEELMHFLKYQRPHQPINFECILTGRGLVNLYEFFYPSEKKLTPQEVGQAIQEGQVSELIETFVWYLGLFVGTMQLTLMPESGIWITGGIAIHHQKMFDHPEFFAGIDASPAYLEQRQTYPLGILCNVEHALIGCGYYAAKRLLGESSGFKRFAKVNRY